MNIEPEKASTKKQKSNTFKRFAFCFFDIVLCGAAGSRTPVQTRKQYAFYMFIPSLIVGCELAQGYPFTPYLLCFRQLTGASS